MEREYHSDKNSPSKVAFIGAVLTLVGGFFLFYNYMESKKIIAYDYMAHNFYQAVEKEEEKEEFIEQEDHREEIEEIGLTGEITNEYIGYLTIPKIHFMKGFLDNRSEDNDVEKNIMVVEGSNYPDVEKGNFIIAGHSGTGWKAFFNDLYQLEKEDLIYIDYKGVHYTYQIQNIYTQPKVGTLAIYRNYNQTTLTLITCTNYDSTTQTIYIAELIQKE